MKKIIKAVLCTMLLITFSQINVKAESAGGQVSSKSGITFLQNEEPPKKEPATNQKVEPQSESKVKTFLPKTGEKMSNLSFYGTLITVFILTVYVILKRRRKYEK